MASIFHLQVISKLGAKSFLLFYNYLPNKQVKYFKIFDLKFFIFFQVTILPNTGSNCCQIGSDQMGREIIQAAKDIVAR